MTTSTLPRCRDDGLRVAAAVAATPPPRHPRESGGLATLTLKATGSRIELRASGMTTITLPRFRDDGRHAAALSG